jgi:hypothetical protein
MPKRKIGHRPPFKPTKDHRALVLSLVGFGIPRAEICNLIINPESGKRITQPTLRKYFKNELETGLATANAKVAQALFRQATGVGNQAVTAAIFWLKSRARWRTTEAYEISTPPGESIKNETRISVDQFAEIAKAIAKDV